MNGKKKDKENNNNQKHKYTYEFIYNCITDMRSHYYYLFYKSIMRIT